MCKNMSIKLVKCVWLSAKNPRNYFYSPPKMIQNICREPETSSFVSFQIAHMFQFAVFIRKRINFDACMWLVVTDYDVTEKKKSMWRKNESAKPTQSWQLLSNVLFLFCLVYGFHISSVSLRFVCVFLAIENICLVHACIFLGHISSYIHICMRFSFSTPLHNWNTTTLEYIQTPPSCFQLPILFLCLFFSYWNWNQYWNPTKMWESQTKSAT